MSGRDSTASAPAAAVRSLQPSRFDGRCVIVTGAGRGIGRAVAQRFAAEGAFIVLVGRTPHMLEETRSIIEENGGTALVTPGDVGCEEDVGRVVTLTLRVANRIDVLVNNAAAYDGTAFLDIRVDVWNSVIRTNLTGCLLMSQAVARAMRGAGSGSIVNVSSIDAFAANETYASYNSSKAALLALGRTMAVELAPFNIRVNSVCPGVTETPWVTSDFADSMDYLRTDFQRVPMRRLVAPAEVAAVCAFLASNDASAMTGAAVTVDCGLTANWYIAETIPPAASSSAVSEVTRADVSEGQDSTLRP
jgi:NAD(P)-dependent dehydrogenase (short-subunit alcohol dehydrogenase family)